MREPESYRDCLARLDVLAPGKEMFLLSELTRLMGVDRRTAEKHFTLTDGYISKVNLARAMSKMGGTDAR